MTSEPDNLTVFRQDWASGRGSATYATNYGGYYSWRHNGHLYRQKPEITHNPATQKRGRKGQSYMLVFHNIGPRRKHSCLHIRVNLRFNPPTDLFTVQTDHIDGDRFNNRADNLRWVTPSENTRKAFSSAAKAEEERLRKQNRYKFKSN